MGTPFRYKNTVVFSLSQVPRESSRDDVAKAFYEKFNPMFTISSIQILPGKVCKVSFQCPDAKKEIENEVYYTVGEVECMVLSGKPSFNESKPLLVQVHHYPFEAPDDELVNVLKTFGEVKSMPRHQHWVNMREVSTGSSLVPMVLEKDIPRTLKIGNFCAKIWYPGQPLHCDICRENHKSVDCPSRDK